MNTEKIRGIYPVLYAFFDEGGGLDRGAMRRQVDFCVESGVHGVAVLGLGTEVNKLDLRERRRLLDWAAEDLRGRLPLAVTVSEPNIAGQIAFVRAAAEAGADWAVLQPPPVRNMPEAEYVRFFGAVAEGSELPLAIQNAPQYIGIGLSNQGLAALHRNHPNVVAVKAECAALEVARLVEETQGAFRILNGRGGLELTDNIRAGCAGMIPGFESADVQARIFDLMCSGRREDKESAEDAYRELLPLLVFLMQSLDSLLCYGKRLAARRLGLESVHDRGPAMRPTPLGLAHLERHAMRLGKLRSEG